MLFIVCTHFPAALTSIVGFFNNAGLFCSSKDLLNTIPKGKETPFCTLCTIGFVFLYTSGQVYVWAVLHGTLLMWAVRFPISYRLLKDSGRIQYAHIISVILAVLVPLVPPCISLRDGYLGIASPSLFCGGRNLDTTYYAAILPISFLVGTASCLLVFIFWTIFKVNNIVYILSGLFGFTSGL